MSLTPLHDNEALTKEVDLLAGEVEKLRVSYEQYFLGLEREEPSTLRDQVQALIRKYSGASIQNAGLNFRLQQTIAKYNTYSTYWNRILREIEEGKYTRDVFRAKLHEKQPRPATAPGKKDDGVAALFEQYVAAKKQCNEATGGLTLESFRKTLNAQAETLKQKTQSKDFTFRVVTEKGKIKIKAVPTR